MQNSNNFEELNQERENLQRIETEWLESLEDLRSSKSQDVNRDLFSALEYLKSCDLFFKSSYIELKKIDNQLQKFSELKNQHKGNQLKSINELINEIENLKTILQNNLENLDDEYTILSEEALRNAQDIVTKFIEIKSIRPSIRNDLDQNLDRNLFLQELQDSLEDYRQAREESVSESIGTIQKMPDNLIPEDLGEEVPEIDPILSQLDTVITECDSALLISESSETE